MKDAAKGIYERKEGWGVAPRAQKLMRKNSASIALLNGA